MKRLKQKIKICKIKYLMKFLKNECGGTMHSYMCGENCRYVVMMTEDEYHDFKWKIRNKEN